MDEISLELYNMFEDVMDAVVNNRVDIVSVDEAVEEWIEILHDYLEDEDCTRFHPSEMFELKMLSDDELREIGRSLYSIN